MSTRSLPMVHSVAKHIRLDDISPLYLRLLMTPGGVRWVMSNWVFDEQQGNSVSRRVEAQRNWERGTAEAVGSRWQALRLIKVDLDHEVRKREKERKGEKHRVWL